MPRGSRPERAVRRRGGEGHRTDSCASCAGRAGRAARRAAAPEGGGGVVRVGQRPGAGVHGGRGPAPGYLLGRPGRTGDALERSFRVRGPEWCLARGLPMVIVNPIPGQESRNSDYLLENGAAIKINNLPTLALKLDALLAEPKRLQQLRDNAKRIGRPQAAFDVAARALRLAGAGVGV